MAGVLDGSAPASDRGRVVATQWEARARRIPPATSMVSRSRPVVRRSIGDGRYLERTLAPSGARLVIAVGAHAQRAIGVRRGDVVGPILKSGRERFLVGLAHPAGFQAPKRLADAVAGRIMELHAFVGA